MWTEAAILVTMVKLQQHPLMVRSHIWTRVTEIAAG